MIKIGKSGSNLDSAPARKASAPIEEDGSEWQAPSSGMESGR
jgi:hypothetical protein